MPLRPVSSAQLFFWILLVVHGCGGETEAESPTSACQPGTIQSCSCPEGATGSRTCRSDGAGYAECSCPTDAGTDADRHDAEQDVEADRDIDAMDDAEAEAGCQNGFSPCGDAGCVDLRSDPNNCGACFTTCGHELETCDFGRCVAAMVDIPHPTTTYAIDATEVTRAQYARWLAEVPSTDDQPTKCSWNDTFAPADACMNEPDACKVGCDDHPQICVDWCDAFAYCKGVGKRLCGHIEGGPVEYESGADASVDQWYYVCTQGTGSSYPYFGGFHADYCNGFGMGVGTTLPVASLTTCQASHPNAAFHGVYDLSGNVGEWEDLCNEDTSNVACALRGGSYATSNLVEEYLSCHWLDGGDLSIASPKAGFRCCSL